MRLPSVSAPCLRAHSDKAPFRRSWPLLAAIAGLLAAAPGINHAADATNEQARWDEIVNWQHELSVDPPAGQNEVEYSTPIKAKLHEAAGAFAKDFPASSHHWDAALLDLKTVWFPAPAAERRPIFEEQEHKAAAIVSSPDAPPAVRDNAELTVLREHMDHLDLVTTPVEAAALESRVAAAVNKNPADPKMSGLQLRRVDLLNKVDPARAAALLDTLAVDANEKTAAGARGRLAQQALGAATLDWNFTDVSGAGFQAEHLRGKVVLIDFWASWCPDCIREMPRVIEAYQRYHAQGLEVVGVSADNSKEALTAYTKKHAMPWPQYFDGKGMDNALAAQYGVRGIPEMWLVDQSGHVVATGLHGDDLDQRIAGLLKL